MTIKYTDADNKKLLELNPMTSNEPSPEKKNNDPQIREINSPICLDESLSNRKALETKILENMEPIKENQEGNLIQVNDNTYSGKKRNSSINLQPEKIRPSLESKKLVDDLNVLISKKKRGVNYLQKKITINLDSQTNEINNLQIHRPLMLPIEQKEKIKQDFNSNYDKMNQDDLNSNKLIKNTRSSVMLRIKKQYTCFDDKLTLKENKKRLSEYLHSVKPIVTDMAQKINKEVEEISAHNSMSDNSDDVMDENEEFNIEKRIEMIKKKEVPRDSKAEFVKWNKEEVEKQNQPKHTKEDEKELFEEVSRKSNTKLEKALIDGITHQVIILIMILLIAYPMLDPYFIMNLIYPSELQPLRPNFCIDLIYLFMSYAINDTFFLKPLNISINQCFYATDFYDPYKNKINPEVERFLFLEFNESQLFFQIQETYNISLLSNHSYNLMTPDLYTFKKEKREEHDYYHTTYSIDQYNNITLYYDTSTIGEIDSILNMMKSIYVAFLLVVGSYVASLDVSDLVILPLDKIFTKLNMNLKNLELIDKDEPDQNNLEREENPDESTDVINLSNLFKDEEMKGRRQSVHIKIRKISKAEKNLKSSLEPYFIDQSLYWLLKLIEMSIGKIGFLIIPISNLDKELKLNLTCPAIKFEIVGLFLKISNTDKLFYKYMNKAPSMLSKLFTIFHSIGVVFSGEIYKKENVNAVFWKRNKKEWMTKSKNYARDLLKKNKNNEAVDEEQGGQSVGINHKHLSDIGILTAIKVINIFYTKTSRTMIKLKQCGVKFDFFLTSGEIMESLLGDEDTANEYYNGNLVTYANSFLDHLYDTEQEINLHSKSQNKHAELNILPRILIHESAYNLLQDQNKKYCLPFEIVMSQTKKAKSSIIIYRHFFNSSHYHIDDDLNESFYIDNFNLENFKTENIHKQRLIFEKHYAREDEEEKSSIENLLISDETYLKATSEFNPSFQSALTLVYDFYQQNDYKKCLSLIKDLQNILKSSQVVADSHLILQIEKLEKILHDRQEINSKEDSYTLKIFS